MAGTKRWLSGIMMGILAPHLSRSGWISAASRRNLFVRGVSKQWIFPSAIYRLHRAGFDRQPVGQDPFIAQSVRFLSTQSEAPSAGNRNTTTVSDSKVETNDVNIAGTISAENNMFPSRNGELIASSSVPLEDWREHPALNPEFNFETWVVPKQHCHAVLCEPLLQPLLASRFFDDLPLSQPTPKLVRSYNATHQLILRNPTPLESSDNKDGGTTDIDQWLLQHDITEGPLYTVKLEPRHFATSHIFATLGIPPLSSFEQVGHVIHLNLKEHHLYCKRIIGEILLECLKPTVRTVVNKVGEVSGEYRTFDMELLAGENSTKVTVHERGATLRFDLSKVYWSTRLAGERKVIMKEILEPENATEPIVVADAFCGVGALCIMLAQTNLKGQTNDLPRVQILANDWNPHAVESLRESAKRNRVSQFVHVSRAEAYDFLVDLGLSSRQLPHHVVMNYPLHAPTFLAALRWWKVPKRKGDVVPRVHVYTFARRQESRTAAEVAVDDIAHNLLPEGNEPTPHRLDHLQSLGCDVRVREVRDVAPGKLVLCVSFKATAQLLRHMQGDFV